MERHLHVYGRLDMVMMIVLPNVAYTFRAIPIRIPTTIFAEMEKGSLKFIRNCRGH